MDGRTLDDPATAPDVCIGRAKVDGTGAAAHSRRSRRHGGGPDHGRGPPPPACGPRDAERENGLVWALGAGWGWSFVLRAYNVSLSTRTRFGVVMLESWSLRRAGSLLASVVFLLSLGTAPRVHAQDDDAARQHFRLGQAHYDNGNFAQAAEEFQQAYELSGRSQLLYNVYLAHRDALQTQQARDALHQYLDEVPNPPDEDRLRARLHHLNQALANQPAVTEPEVTEPEVTEPEVTVPEVTVPEVTVPGLVNPANETDAADAPQGSSPVPWVLVGTGGALLVGGLVAGGISRGAFSDLQELCPGSVCPAGSDWEATRDRGQRSARMGDSLVIVGLATAATGVVLHFVMKPDDDDEVARVNGGVACDGTGCMASVGGTF